MANEQTAVFDYEHFNLNEVDPTFHPVEKGLYSLRLGKFQFKTVIPKSGKNQGIEVPLIDASFSIINHDQFSGRRVRGTFWLMNTFDQKSLRRLMDAIGIPQEANESIKDYVERLAMVNPAPEFRAFVEVISKGTDEVTGKPNEENIVKWNQVLPIN